MSPISTQSPTAAVTRCIVAVPHFTYNKRLEGQSTRPPHESNPDSIKRGGGGNQTTTQTLEFLQAAMGYSKSFP